MITKPELEKKIKNLQEQITAANQLLKIPVNELRNKSGKMPLMNRVQEIIDFFHKHHFGFSIDRSLFDNSINHIDFYYWFDHGLPSQRRYDLRTWKTNGNQQELFFEADAENRICFFPERLEIKKADLEERYLRYSDYLTSYDNYAKEINRIEKEYTDAMEKIPSILR